MSPGSTSVSLDRGAEAARNAIRRLRLPGGLASAPVNDRDLAACERVGQAIDAAVDEWLTARKHDRLFVTLATPDFSTGAAVLVRSLRTVSDAPVLVLTQGGFEPDIEAEDIAYLEVPPLLRPGHVFPSDAPHLAVTLSKLWVFSLTRPARVAYLDADCLVLQPLDALFAGEGFAAVPDLFANYETRCFNAGVFAFTPSAEIARELFRLLPEFSVADGDQSVLNAYFPDWRQLPQGMNFLRAHALLRAQAQDRALRVVHYTPSKPWRPAAVSSCDPVLAPLDDLWTTRLTPDEHLALVRDWRARLAAAEANVASWMGAGAGKASRHEASHAEDTKRSRRERRLERWLIAVAVMLALQSSLLAWHLLR